MKKNSFLFGIGVVIIFFLIIFKQILFPLDILYYFPSFSMENWERPHNSLLSDPIHQFEPWRKFAKESLLRGEFPLWNNLNSSGAPFFANPQTAVLYPINFLYYIFPVDISLNIIPFLKLFLFGWFVFFYLRSIGITPLISILSSVIPVFSGFFFTWLLWPHTNVFLLFPVMLLCVEKLSLAKKQFRYLWYLTLSAAYFLAILGGHPETLFLISFVFILYVLLRFWSNWKQIAQIGFSLLAGTLLGALQLIPFVEYLFNSHALSSRLTDHSAYLPIKALILLLFPYVLGAPHIDYYKSIDPSTNFQEAIGAYVGIIVLILGILTLKKQIKNPVIKIWGIIVLISFFLSYNPFFSKLPFIKTIAISRMVAFIPLGFCVLVAHFLTKDNVIKFKKIERYLLFFLICTFIFYIGSEIFSLTDLLTVSKRQEMISISIMRHILFIFVTTVVAFVVLIKRIRGRIKIFTVFTLIYLQSISFFFTYHYFSPLKQYYPETILTKTLKQLPEGKIIEVGNPNLPENINMIYDLKHSQNYDALEIKSYKNFYENVFPKKNQWGNPDEVMQDDLKKLNIKYVISDYDINLKRHILQSNQSKILPPITISKPLVIRFSPQNSSLEQIRFLTANFNRFNTCTLSINLRLNKEELVKKTVKCSKFRDFMYFTVPLSYQLDISKQYELAITGNLDEDNSIALWGDGKNPYFELLFQDTDPKRQEFVEVLRTDNLYVFSAKNINDIEFNGKYKEILRKNTSVLYETESLKDEIFKTYITNYPGWRAQIDGKEVELDDEIAFIAFDVPSGRHAVKIYYTPYSLLAGIFITFFTFLGILIFSLRKESESAWHKKFVDSWNRWAARKIKIAWWSHIVVVFSGLFLSITSYALIVSKIKINFVMPLTTSINWFTVHSYPRQQDYFYFYGGVLYIFVCTGFIWAIWVWKKNKK